MTKQFAIYKTKWRDTEHEVWHLHRKFETGAQCKDAFRDLTRRSKKNRIWVYVPLPTLSQEHKILRFPKEQGEQLFKQAK